MSNVTISPETMSVLKNFSTINSSILIREGNKLKTISVGENVVAQFNAVESFPQSFGIYDLNQFLTGVSLFVNPVLVFSNNEYVTIKSGSRSAKYYFSNPEITLKAAPEKDVRFPGADMEFSLTQEDILAMQKASAVYDINDVKFQSDADGVVTLSLIDKENETSNTFSVTVQGQCTGEYEMFMKMENIRLMHGDYRVKISKHLITEWRNTSIDLMYYIALEP